MVSRHDKIALSFIYGDNKMALNNNNYLLTKPCLAYCCFCFPSILQWSVFLLLLIYACVYPPTHGLRVRHTSRIERKREICQQSPIVWAYCLSCWIDLWRDFFTLEPILDIVGIIVWILRLLLAKGTCISCSLILEKKISE